MSQQVEREVKVESMTGKENFHYSFSLWEKVRMRVKLRDEIWIGALSPHPHPLPQGEGRMERATVKCEMKKFLVFAFICACIASVSAPVWCEQPAKEIVFPPPPDTPRVKYLYSLTKAKDMSSKKEGFLDKMWNFVLGKGDSGLALNRPYGVCVDRDHIYVADTEGTAVVVFDIVKKEMNRLGGTLEGKLVSPIGVACDGKGKVFVTDSIQNTVKVFDSEGNYLYQFGSLEKLKKPTGISFDKNRERVLIADTGNSRVLAYNTTGQFLLEVGRKGTGDGEMSVPVNVVADPEGKIYVVDTILCRVQVFSPEGEFLFKFGEQGDMAGYFARPRGIALDSERNIYVTDALFNAVQIFDQEGKLLLFFGAGGSVAGAFELPAGIFIDENDRIYVADSFNRRIQVFQYLK